MVPAKVRKAGIKREEEYMKWWEQGWIEGEEAKKSRHVKGEV